MDSFWGDTLVLHVWALLWIGVGVAGVLYLPFYMHLRGYVRARHPRAWGKISQGNLAEDAMDPVYSWRYRSGLFALIWNGGHLHLNDPELSRLCRRHIAFHVVYASCLVILVAWRLMETWITART